MASLRKAKLVGSKGLFPPAGSSCDEVLVLNMVSLHLLCFGSLAMGFDVTIAFFFFNRPEPTRRVFEAIRAQQPNRLLLIGDGPRPDIEGEAELVDAVREIVSCVDWDCDVESHLSSSNLGCRRRMATGLDWAFDRSEQLIILEDDCLPEPSFFGYCRELLQRYQDNPEVMMVSGDNFQPAPRSPNSYYFSRWAHIWGWASWRRAWEHYDLTLSRWPERKQCKKAWQFDHPDYESHWSAVFDQVHAGKIDTWDFSWQYSIFQQQGLVILPEVNLVSNLGFGVDATHTTQSNSKLANLPTSKMGNLQHPPRIERNVVADDWTFRNIFAPEEATKPNPATSWFRRLLKMAS